MFPDNGIPSVLLVVLAHRLRGPFFCLIFVIPASRHPRVGGDQIPAFAGMTFGYRSDTL